MDFHFLKSFDHYLQVFSTKKGFLVTHERKPLKKNTRLCQRTVFRLLLIVRPRFNIATLTSDIHVFLGLPLLRLPSGSHSNANLGSLSYPIRITWPNQPSCFSSIICIIFFFTFNASLIVSLRTLSSLDLPADLLQKSISKAIHLSFCLFFKVQVSYP